MKKKILIIPSWYPTEKNHFFGNNYRIQLLALEKEFNVTVLFGARKYINYFSIFISLLKSKYTTFSLQTPPNGIGFYFPQLKIPMYLKGISKVTNLFDKLNYILMGKSYLKAIKQLNHNDYDLIHAFSSNHGGIAAFYIYMKLNIPYVISEHQVFNSCFNSGFEQRTIANVFHFAAKTIAISEYQKRNILLFMPEITPVKIGNLVDETLFLLHPEKQPLFTIITVTYKSAIKDYQTLFSIIKEFSIRNNGDFKVILIGNNWSQKKIPKEQHSLYSIAVKMDVDKYIEFFSFVNKKDMSSFYNKADVYISTSIAETFGLSQAEAMMCGIPVVSTENGGIDECISKNTGVKLPIKDIDGLVNTLIKIKNGELKFNKLAIRNETISKLGRDVFLEKTTKLYNRVINGNLLK